MIDIIQKGGILMYPIMFCSVLALGIFLERLFVLRKERFLPALLLAKLKELIDKEQYGDAADICAIQDCAVSRITLNVLEHKLSTWDQLTSIAEEAGKQEADKLSRFQDTLVTIVAITPLLGLLGTVFAMITIFNVLSTGAIGDGQALSGGIALALITTAAGLSVAIPTQIFYHIVKYRSDMIINELEKQTVEIITKIALQRNNMDR